MDVNHSLISAVREGNLERAKELINSFGLSYSQGWSSGYVLLCDALKRKHAAVAKLLLTSGSKVNSKTIKPTNTPLHLAAINGDIEIVEMILVKGAKIDTVNKDGRTPLHSAIENKKMEVTELLLKYGAHVNCVCTSTWWKNAYYTPLHFATEKESKEVVKLLLNRGANVDAKGVDNSITPLHIAAEKGYVDIAEDLLNHGACIHSLTLKEEYTPLLFATKAGHETVVRLLLEHGDKVDNQAKDGKTILHLAVEGYLMIVENVLKYYPDINNQSNRNSLKIAVYGYKEQYKKIVEALLEYGFIVNAEDANNSKLLHAAVKKGYLKIVEDLLKYGADVNTIEEGFTPLHSAVRNKQEEVAKLLISYEADINAQDRID